MAGHEDNGGLTIDLLSQQTGMTTRNIRAHQSRGLLRPPTVRARTGYYDAEHLRRIRLIQEMQAQGFNLEAIRHLLDLSTGAGEHTIAFQRAVLTPFFTEQPELVSQSEMETAFGATLDPAQLEEAERVGIIRQLDEETWEIASPTMLRAGRELIEMGIPLEQVIAAGETVREHTEAIAREFVNLYVTEILDPMLEDGKLGESGLARASEAVERLRPLASEALLAGFGRMMATTIEEELRREAA